LAFESQDRPDGANRSGFAAEIKNLRKLRGISQRELATTLGINFTYLSKLENGRAEPPSEETVRKLGSSLAPTQSDADALAERLLALAGKVPPELKRRAASDHNFASAIRELTAADEAQIRAVRTLLGRSTLSAKRQAKAR